MTPVPREGLAASGALGWEASLASVEDSAAASRVKVVAGVVAGVAAGIEAGAAELGESRPRTRSGFSSPSWAAWSRI